MTIRWISDRFRKWVRRRPRRRSPRRVLSLVVLEGRSIPSVTPFVPPSDCDPIPCYRADETTLDGLIRLTPWTNSGSVQIAKTEKPDAPSESAAPLSVAAFMGMFLGSAVAIPYDLEVDA